MDKSLFETRYGRNILETEVQFFNGEKREVTFAISNAALNDPEYSDKSRFHLHKNTLLKSIFVYAKSFKGFDHAEVVRDLLALKECCVKKSTAEKNT